MTLHVHIDGGARGNPGPAAAAVVIETVQEDESRPGYRLVRAVHEGAYILGKATNNVAEYSALIRALQILVKHNRGEAHFFSDSELLVKQITGEYRVKSAELADLNHEAQRLLLQLDAWQIKHVRREQNKRADQLANMALDQNCDVEIRTIDDPSSADDPILLGPNGMPVPRGAAPSAAPSRSTATRYTPPAAPASSVDDDDDPPPPPSTKRGKQPAAIAWTASFPVAPGPACPAKCVAGKPYAFGPTTPQGFCVYAAQAVLDEVPLRDAAGSENEMAAECERCGAKVEIRLNNTPKA